MKFSPRFTPQINKNGVNVGFNLPQRQSKSTVFALSLDSLFEGDNLSTSAPSLWSVGKYAYVTPAEVIMDEQAVV